MVRTAVAHTHDVPGQPELLEGPDDGGRDVDLAQSMPMVRGRRKRVVVVVPRLAEREEGEPREVARLVTGVVRLLAEEVAERVDRVRDVVHDEHPHESTPEKARERGL